MYTARRGEVTTLELDKEEAEYLGDILQMWIEGVEAEIPSLTQPSPEVHWSRFQLRKQLQTAQQLKLRLELGGS